MMNPMVLHTMKQHKGESIMIDFQNAAYLKLRPVNDGDFASMTGSAVNYAWFVFKKGYTKTAQLHWIA